MNIGHENAGTGTPGLENPGLEQGPDAALLRQLRELRREQPPGADLWPGIAARIATAAPAPLADVVPLRRRPRPGAATRFVPWALAASLALAVGVAWQLRPAPDAPVAAPAPTQYAHAAAHPIRRAADAMTREYDAALRELQASGARAASPAAADELDRSAAEIRTALARDPDARFLLDRLRRTYEKRLELTQRAVLG